MADFRHTCTQKQFGDVPQRRYNSRARGMKFAG